MIAYQTDADGIYIGPVECDLSPLEPGVWLIPGGAYEIAPPELGENERAVWSGNGWDVVDVTPQPEPEPEPEPVTEENVRLRRHAAYVSADGPDSVFMRWQRGDATEQEWLGAVQAVKDQHPYPDPV